MSLINYKDIKNLTSDEKDKIQVCDICFPEKMKTRIVNTLISNDIEFLGVLKDAYLKNPKFYLSFHQFGKKSVKILLDLLFYAYPEINKIEPKILYTFNNNNEEKECTQIAK